MSHIVIGLFQDTKRAGDAVSELKENGFTKEISVMAYDEKQSKGEVHEVKQSVAEGAGIGSTVGAVAGALMGVFSGITSVAVPGVGILVGGPLVALLGVTGGALGSLAGGIVGALVDLGINEPTAKVYEEKIKRGNVLVGVSAEEGAQEEVRSLLKSYGATDITTIDHD